MFFGDCQLDNCICIFSEYIDEEIIQNDLQHRNKEQATTSKWKWYDEYNPAARACADSEVDCPRTMNVKHPKSTFPQKTCLSRMLVIPMMAALIHINCTSAHVRISNEKGGNVVEYRTLCNETWGFVYDCKICCGRVYHMQFARDSQVAGYPGLWFCIYPHFKTAKNKYPGFNLWALLVNHYMHPLMRLCPCL